MAGLKKQGQFAGLSAAAGVGPSHGTHADTAADRTDANVNVPCSLQQFRYGKPHVFLPEPLMPLQGKDKPQFF